MIDNSSDSSLKTLDSVDDKDREVLRWTVKTDRQLTEWLDMITKSADSHNRHAKKCKRLYRGITIPAAAIPLVVGVFQPYLLNDGIIIAILLAISAILSATNASLNYGALVSQHLNTEYRYRKLAMRIQYILVKPKNIRSDADVTLSDVYHDISEIGETAPDI
jgi:hypothetical protein